MNPRRDYQARMSAEVALAIAFHTAGWHWVFWVSSLVLAVLNGIFDLVARKDYDK